MSNKPRRVIPLAIVGIAATTSAYAGALAVLPWVSTFLWSRIVTDRSESVLWLGYYDGSLVFLCCLLGGLVQAALLTVTRTARAHIAVATALGAVGGWSLQAYAVAYKGVSGYPFSGHGGLVGPFRSITAGDFIIYVTGAFVLVGVCQALTIRRSVSLAVFWPVVWLIAGLAFAFAFSQWSPLFKKGPEDLIFVSSGALLGLLAAVWVLVPLEIRLPHPAAIPPPIAAAAGAITLAAVVLGGVYGVSAVLSGPIDDPGYFCGAPDPSPAAGIAASIVLQECAAGKTFSLRRGQTIAIELPGSGHGVDTSTGWSDFNVSNTSVVSEVTPRETLSGQFGQEEVTLYKALGSGEASVGRVLTHCTANGGGVCDRGHRWSVTIRVL